MTKPGRTGKPEKVLPLTSLRFFAALAIVFHHYAGESFPSAVQNRWVAPVVYYSAVAVFFFFILSGYILSYVYLRECEQVDSRRFWISRFARIYPLYIVTVLVTVPRLVMARIAHFGAARAYIGTAATLAAHALLVQHWVPQLGALNYPSWSISAEAFFYLVFPWLGVYLWRRSTGSAVLVGAAWFVISWAVLAMGVTWPRFAVEPHVMPLFELNLFVAGIVLGKVHKAIQSSARADRWLTQQGGLLAAAALVALLIFTEWKSSVPFAPMHDAFTASLFLVIILGFASGNRIVRTLGTVRWLVVLGESSYGLYLIHAPLYLVLTELHLRPGPGFFVLYVAGAIALSVLSFYWFETPARLAILRYFATRSRESTAAAALSQ